MNKFIVAALIVNSVGCIYWSKNDTKHYSLYISPYFTADQANMITDAANEWQYSMDNYITFDGAGVENNPNTINIYPSTMSELKPYAACGITWFDTHEKIQIAVDGDDFRQIALHELGHAIGAIHLTTKGTVMYPNQGGAGTHISCADVQDVCDAWGNAFQCDASKMNACLVHPVVK